MKKNKLALFDLDDTLFDGDTEAEWVKYMDHRGFIQDFNFYSKMEAFEKNYREGRLDVDEYSEFLLSPIIGKSLKELLSQDILMSLMLVQMEQNFQVVIQKEFLMLWEIFIKEWQKP